MRHGVFSPRCLVPPLLGLVTLPFAPARLDLDPDLELLADILPPVQVDILRPCTP